MKNKQFFYLLFIIFLISLNSCKKNGDIHGVVYDANTNELLENAKIEILPSSLPTTKTNTKGEFNIPTIEEGFYFITISKYGYHNITEGLEVKNGENIIRTFYLTKIVDLSIQVNQDIDTVKQGKEIIVTFTIKLTPDVIEKSNIRKLEITTPDILQNITKTYSGNDNTTINETYEYTVSDTTKIGKLRFNFTVYDDFNQTEVENSKFINVVAHNSLIIMTIDDVRFSFSTDDVNALMGISFKDGQLTRVSGTSVDADLSWCYHIGMTPNRALVSPDNGVITEILDINSENYTTADKNNTLIKTYTGSWYDLTDETIEALEFTASETISYLGATGNGYGVDVENTILVFKTADGKKGAIQIVDWGTGTKFDVHANAKIKVQVTGDATK